MKTKTTYGRLILWAFIVVCAWLGNGLILVFLDDRGSYGDMFGAVNALFSGLAFAGIIYTIHLQRHELELQREELRLTRTEISGQREQLQLQNETLRAQTLEATLFQMLDLLNGIVNAIDIVQQNTGFVTRGRDAIRVYFDRLRTSYQGFDPNTSSLKTEQRIEAVYSQWYKSHQTEMGHYYRTLYNIVKFIHNSDTQKKKLYTNLVRAQLSDQELGVLFYNCLSSQGRLKFKPLVEEYSLLKNVPDTILFDPKHKSLYDGRAFK